MYKTIVLNDRDVNYKNVVIEDITYKEIVLTDREIVFRTVVIDDRLVSFSFGYGYEYGEVYGFL